MTTGSRTLKDAINEALRDWVANVDDTHYLLGTAAGPHPFPMMVRDFQRVIGAGGARADARAGRPAARRGRRVRRRRLERDRHLPRASSTTRTCGWSASRRAATASRPAGTPPRSPAARPACCTARCPTCCRTRTARPSSRTRSRPASTTRASARSTRWLKDIGRAEYRPVTDAEAMEAFAAAVPHRGHHPGDRVGARARRRAASSAASSGRTALIAGQPVRPRRQGHGHRGDVVRLVVEQ